MRVPILLGLLLAATAADSLSSIALRRPLALAEPAFRDSVQSITKTGFRVEIVGAASESWVLRDPRGNHAAIRGIASESGIVGCKVVAKPDVFSGDCDGFRGTGSSFDVSDPLLGEWSLTLTCKQLKCKCGQTRVRFVAHRPDRPTGWDLLTLAGSDSLTWSVQVTERSVRVERTRPATRLTTSGQVVETDGRSFASTEIALRRVSDPGADPNAVFLSVGPMGAEVPVEPIRSAGVEFRMEPPRRRLRVTISTAERASFLTIDEILTGRADSRSFLARYRVDPFFDEGASGLWEALQKAPRVLGPDPTDQPISWLSPTMFEWTTRSDTLVFDQRADSLFTVTVRPRIR